ncbi:intracellular protein transport protein USO1 isoform X2 [Nematostella vectensis]|uniref:intracellular protein transport protein USO1 isoform X2 n=1 Tax=Nematostella vectensis TaxID=45351 RepID=UPI0020775AA3|nr:intracellular protein transport protein USO1 isoform X2 [Nematostella vectensis]
MSGMDEKEVIVKEMDEVFEKETDLEVENKEQQEKWKEMDDGGTMEYLVPDNDAAIGVHAPDNQADMETTTPKEDGELTVAAPKDESELTTVGAHKDESELTTVGAHKDESERTVGAHKDESELTTVGTYKDESELTTVGAHKDESELTTVGAHKDESELTTVGAHKDESERTTVGAHKDESELTTVGAHKDESELTTVGAHKDESELTTVGAHKDESERTVAAAKDDCDFSVAASELTAAVHDKEDMQGVVASFKAELSRLEEKNAQLITANKELQDNVTRLQTSLETIQSDAASRLQSAQLSLKKYRNYNHELWNNDVGQIRENEQAREKIKGLVALQAENAAKIAELMDSTSKLADVNAELVEAANTKDEEIEMLREQLEHARKKKQSRWQRIKSRVRTFFGR